jgi:ABC-type antimicrobial peptide transport system permease subunit
LQVEDRVNTELNVYLSDWTGVVGAIIGYGIGFVIVYFITKVLLERYFKGKAQPQPTAIPSFGIALGQQVNLNKMYSDYLNCSSLFTPPHS